MQLQAAWALANLALHPVGKTRLAVLKPVLPMVRTLETCRQEELLHQATRCLGTLLTEPACRAAFLELGKASGHHRVVDGLLGLTSHPTSSVCEAAIRSLVHACALPHSVAPVLLGSTNGVERIAAIMSGPPGKMRLMATSCVLQMVIAAACSAHAPSPRSPTQQVAHRALEGRAGAHLRVVMGMDEPLHEWQAHASSEMQATRLDSLVIFVAPLLGILMDANERSAEILIQAAHVLGRLFAMQDNAGGRNIFAELALNAGAVSTLQAHVCASPFRGVQEATAAALDALSYCLTPNSRKALSIFSRPSDVAYAERSRPGARRRPGPSKLAFMRCAD